MNPSLSSPSLPDMNDHEALAVYIMDQMALMSSSQQTTDGPSEGAGRPRLSEMHTCYLPNFLWFQPVAADPTNKIRPTSLCSGTGITGGSQYLQPEMLKVFSVFGSYLLGSGHLFEDDREGHINNRRRAAFWVDTIDENDDEDDSADDASVKWSGSDDGTVGSDCDDPRRVQKEFIEKVILDLRRSQMMMEPKMEPKIMHDYKISDR